MTPEVGAMLAPCDFCGRVFPAPRWDCRTCVACAAAGAPDQSVGEFAEYLRDVGRWRERAKAGLRLASGKARQGVATSPGLKNRAGHESDTRAGVAKALNRKNGGQS